MSGGSGTGTPSTGSAQKDIINLALGKIGSKGIASVSDGTPQQVKAIAAWDYIKNEVFQAIKPKWATTRVALTQSATVPTSYDYAYPLPSGFLAFADPTEQEKSVTPDDYPYIIEMLTILTVPTLCLLTDYDDADEDLVIRYVYSTETYTLWDAAFTNAFAIRLAAELALTLTEDKQKHQNMMVLYEQAKTRAKAVTRALDYLPDETGSDDWVNAGRGDG